MPAPASITFSAAAKKAANDELLALLDAGASNAKIRLYNNDDIMLAEIPLGDPAGTVNATTGVLTFDIDGTDTAIVDGVCAYAKIVDSDGTAHVTLPVSQGATPVSGYLVLNEKTVIQGVTVTILSAAIE